VWPNVEKEMNFRFIFGSGQPLYKCHLLRIKGGYVLMSIYHHGAADGTSGLLITGEVMKQYKRLEDGKELELRATKPRGSMEELCRTQLAKQGNDEAQGEVVKDLIRNKVSRANNWKPFLPFDMSEHEDNKKGDFINRVLFRDGTKDNYDKIRARCKAEGVSVGSVALAASYMAMGQMHAKESKVPWEGMRDQWMDIPVNIRQRVEGGMEDCAAFYVTEVTFKCDVTPQTKIWELARNIQDQLKAIIGRDEHLLFAKVKEEWETGEETKELAVTSWQEGKVSDVIVSNLMFYKYPTDLGWGEITSLYCGVGVAVPFCSNLELLFQACAGKFAYTLVYCPGENNQQTANDYMDAFVKFMENSHSGNQTVV